MTAGHRRRLAVGGLLAVTAVALSACGDGAALGLVRTACTHVDRSIRLYDASLGAASPGVAATDQAQAVAQLETAQPEAATAAGEDAQWQALMTTLSESPRIPEQDLVYALGQQCAEADSPGGDGYVGTGTPPVQPTGTTQAPTTQAPTTQAPTTQAPTAQAPTTQPPTTSGAGTAG